MIVLLVGAMPAGAAAAEPAPPIAFRAADGGLLREVLAETGVSQTPTAPSMAGYFAAWVDAVVAWVTAFFSKRPGLAAGLLDAAGIIAVLAVVVAIALLGLSIVRRVRGWRGPRGPAVPRLDWAEVPEAQEGRDRLAWRQQIEAALSRGDVAGALEALWWWLALSLPLEASVDKSWTTRELLARARRPELLRQGATLDVLMYGPRAPSAQDVSSCLARFEEALP